MGRNGNANPRKIDADDAYNRAVTRGDQVDTAFREPLARDPQKVGKALDKSTGKG
jgi:hypothetical protein